MNSRVDSVMEAQVHFQAAGGAEALVEVVADKGYAAHAFREAIWGMGSRPAIPAKSNEAPVACPAWIYNNRHHVENAWARLKEWRAVATRYEGPYAAVRASQTSQIIYRSRPKLRWCTPYIALFVSGKRQVSLARMWTAGIPIPYIVIDQATVSGG